MLSADELERYARHIVLREVGGPGQQALKEASVLVIGAGGLGAPALMYLAAAGVGQLGVVDDDVVSLSNLQRQIIHTTPDIGRRKADTAAERIYALNPHVAFAAHATRLNAGNAMELIGGYDIVLDGSDNFETRYLVSDACFLAARPLFTASLGLSLPISRTAAAGHRADLRRGWHSGRTRRRARLDDGAGSDPRDRRLRRGAGRKAPDDRRAQHAVRDAELQTRSAEPFKR
jgi:hypothetical protein